jgi:hypothetical protein
MKKNDIKIDVNLQTCILKKNGNPKEGGQEK